MKTLLSTSNYLSQSWHFYEHLITQFLLKEKVKEKKKKKWNNFSDGNMDKEQPISQFTSNKRYINEVNTLRFLSGESIKLLVLVLHPEQNKMPMSVLDQNKKYYDYGHVFFHDVYLSLQHVLWNAGGFCFGLVWFLAKADGKWLYHRLYLF